MTWRLWPLLPQRSIPRYLEHMERDHGLRFMGLGWVPFLAKYKRIHPLHAANYDIDYFPERNPAEIQEYFDMCEASGWEPVLQQNHYKIYREQMGGAIPLYWDEEERKAVWKKARNKHLWTTLICLALIFLLLWMVLFSNLKSADFTPDFILYYAPGYQQLFSLLILATLLYSIAIMLGELSGLFFRWENDPPTILYGAGIVLNLITYTGLLLLVYSSIMTVVVEHREVGTFFAVLLGNCIGNLTRGYLNNDAKERRKLKGIFGPPKFVAIAFTLILLLLTILLLFYPLFYKETPGKPQWISTENIACETIVYDLQDRYDSPGIYQLRNTGWIRRDLDRHSETLISVLADRDIFHYITPEGLAQGIENGGSDLNVRRAHLAATELLLDDPEIDQIRISQIGHRYILLCGDTIYRLKCEQPFYEDPTLGMEETDVPEIEAKGLEIYKELVSQKEELEKMFLN